MENTSLTQIKNVLTLQKITSSFERPAPIDNKNRRVFASCEEDISSNPLKSTKVGLLFDKRA